MFFRLSGTILFLEWRPQDCHAQLSLKPLQNYLFLHIYSSTCAYIVAVVAWEVRKLYRRFGYAELPTAEAALLWGDRGENGSCCPCFITALWLYHWWEPQDMYKGHCGESAIVYSVFQVWK